MDRPVGAAPHFKQRNFCARAKSQKSPKKRGCVRWQIGKLFNLQQVAM
jgi:hypothetical protein